jgi:hypothetical protein
MKSASVITKNVFRSIKKWQILRITTFGLKVPNSYHKLLCDAIIVRCGKSPNLVMCMMQQEGITL